MKFLSCWLHYFSIPSRAKNKEPNLCCHSCHISATAEAISNWKCLLLPSFRKLWENYMWRKNFPTIQKFKDCVHSDFEDISNFPYKKLWGISMVFYHRVKITFLLCYLIYVGKAFKMDTTFLPWPRFWSTV